MTETASVPITYAEVINAARALESEGAKLTILAVRERIGRGSFSTVKKFLERWNEERETRGAPSPATPLPASLETLWAEACKQAEESVAQERRALEQLTAELEARFEQLRAEVAASDSRRLQSEQRLVDMQKVLERSQADVEELKSQRSELEQRLYGMLELAAQERHSFLAAAEGLQQMQDQLHGLSESSQLNGSTGATLLELAQETSHQLRQFEQRLIDSSTADQQRRVDQDEHWRRALAPLGTLSSTLETVLRTVRQRPRAQLAKRPLSGSRKPTHRTRPAL